MSGDMRYVSKTPMDNATMSLHVRNARLTVDNKVATSIVNTG